MIDRKRVTLDPSWTRVIMRSNMCVCVIDCVSVCVCVYVCRAQGLQCVIHAMRANQLQNLRILAIGPNAIHADVPGCTPLRYVRTFCCHDHPYRSILEGISIDRVISIWRHSIGQVSIDIVLSPFSRYILRSCQMRISSVYVCVCVVETSPRVYKRHIFNCVSS
jgi:hypothetical protein